MIPIGNPYKAKYYKKVLTENNQELRANDEGINFRYIKISRTKTNTIIDNQEVEVTQYLMTTTDIKAEQFKRNDYIEFNNKIARISMIASRQRTDVFRNDLYIYDITLIEDES